jgi:acetyl esterase/lipase
MKNPKRTTLWAMLLAGTLSAHGMADQPVLRLWPDGLPTGAQTLDPQRVEKLRAENTSERISYVGDPSITLFRAPAEKANGCAIVVCPGGGYNILAWEKEGVEVAQWLNSLGVTAAVLKYRVPRRDPERPHAEPLQDVQRAIRLVRHHAQAWSVARDRVGVLGFSAGGHLAVMAGTHWDQESYDPTDEADQLSCRPDFMVPIYAAYLGLDDRTDRLSPLVRVTQQTPPTFMAVTQDDQQRGIDAALLFIQLTEQDVTAEVHVYSKGGHGYGLRRSENPVSNWPQRCAQWMRATGLLGDQPSS